MEPWEVVDLEILEKINRDWTHPILDGFFVWLTKPPHEELYFVGGSPDPAGNSRYEPWRMSRALDLVASR